MGKNVIDMKWKIAILGSAVDELVETRIQTKKLGEVLSQYRDRVILLNGACPGVPNQVISAAQMKNHIDVWGFCSYVNRNAQLVGHPSVDISLFDRLFFIPKDFPFAGDVNVCRKYRNVILTASCDAGIIVSGRWGTMNEFTNLYDMGKVIGVLLKTGGVADVLQDLVKRISKETKAVLFFEKDQQKLVEIVLAEMEKRKL